jgi:glucosamine--fructose-6-phosphate aminotransferase (isomerizing)
MPRRPTDPLAGPPDPWVGSEIPPFRSRPPYLMTEMIAAEPSLAERLIRRLRADAATDALADAVRAAESAGEPIVVTGCGTSEHAGLGIGAMLEEALGRPAGRPIPVLQALEVSRRPPVAGLVIGVSHEGGTAVTNAALHAAGNAGAATALITAGTGSPGAELADVVLATGEMDASWCHTVGYLSPLVAGLVIASRISGSRLDAVAVHALLDVAADPRAASDVAAGLTGIDRLVVVGAGVDRIAARELALKVAEGARLPAEAHELETAVHGHLAAATRWTGLVLILADPAVTAHAMDRVARVLDAARSLSMPTAAILGERAATEVDTSRTPAGRLIVPSTGRVRGVGAVLLGTAIPLQLLAERLARARGVNPDTLGREDPSQAAAHA